MSVIHTIKQLVPQTLKNWFHFLESFFAAVAFGFPAKKLTVVGVTGTNGKTTTANLIARILEEDGKRVALASTINFRVAGEETVNTSKFTTLSRWRLQKFLHDAVSAGCTHAVLEVSSHALDQRRLLGIFFTVAVVTNVTREHLDYHKTMEVYRRAKKRLFEKAKNAVVNLDMREPEFFLEGKYERTLTCSTVDETADFYAEGIRSNFGGSEFSVQAAPVRLRLPGRFNIENALAAMAAASLLGVSLGVSARAVGLVERVPGRMDLVENHLGATILVDYAVTPDSLEKLYELVASMRKPESKVVAVFGACGERDRGKRPIMGEIVSSNADVVILTNEDPYHENPDRILREIENGINGKKKGEDYFRIFDRRNAIRKALSILSQNDILLVTGKGAEETMAIGDKRIPWNDRTVIEEELQKMK